MPLHDWSEVDHGLFHAFHTLWLTRIAEELNNGLLPTGYIALPEQHSEGYVTDVSTYATGPAKARKRRPDAGGVAVAEPGTDERVIAQRKVVYPGRRLTVQHFGSRRVVAVIELVSNSNKDRRESVGQFAGKVVDFLNTGVHVLVIDILPPNRSSPQGMHAAIWSILEHRQATTSLPDDRPMLIASYRAERKPIAYLNYATVGRPLPSGPLYFDDRRFVDVPLHATYQETFNRLPKEVKAELPRR